MQELGNESITSDPNLKILHGMLEAYTQNNDGSELINSLKLLFKLKICPNIPDVENLIIDLKNQDIEQETIDLYLDPIFNKYNKNYEMCKSIYNVYQVNKDIEFFIESIEGEIN